MVDMVMFVFPFSVLHVLILQVINQVILFFTIIKSDSDNYN